MYVLISTVFDIKRLAIILWQDHVYYNVSAHDPLVYELFHISDFQSCGYSSNWFMIRYNHVEAIFVCDNDRVCGGTQGIDCNKIVLYILAWLLSM